MAARAAALTGLVLVALAAVGASEPPGAEQRMLDPAEVPWSRLELEARKLFVTARTEIRLASADVDELIASPRGVGLMPKGKGLARIELDAAFGGRRSETKLWFDPRRATAMQRLKLRVKKRDGYQKMWRFTEGGVYSHRRAPADRDEGGGPIEKWSRVAETFYAHSASREACGPIAEPSQVLYLVSAVGAEGPYRVCTFSDETLHRVELRPRGKVALGVDYERRTVDGVSRRRGRVEVDKILLQARSMDGQDEEFEFLGLEGDVEIYLDGRVPVEIAGRLPGLGRVRVKLVAADLE